MRRPLRNRRIAAALLALAGCRPGSASEDAEPLPALGLFGTIPVYWGESDDIGEVLASDARPDWVRSRLEQRFALVPLDALEDDTLAGQQRLLLAQPRALAPSENLALDRWVRAGGRALVLADPMLTRRSMFPIGDPRRPQDVALLSPILARWGLELRFDERQGDAERWIAEGGGELPVRLAGEFVTVPHDGAANCILSASKLVARCRVGAGQVTLVADAAVLDGDDAGEASADRRRSLDALVAESLGE
ncbi:MAG: ABC transporter [Erythrobacter sp.]|jgi:hypothetical protein